MQVRLSGQGWREKAEEERRGGMDRGEQRRVGTRRFIQSHNFQILNFHVKIHPNRIMDELGPDLLWKLSTLQYTQLATVDCKRMEHFLAAVRGAFCVGREGN